MLQTKTHHRVRYAETDQMGYVYYGEYAKLYEIGRAEMMRDLDLSYAHMEREVGVMMPVMSLNQRFVRPGRYDELLTITTTLRTLPERTITFHIEVHGEDGKLRNGGSVRLCFVEQATGKTVTAPDYLMRALKPYF